MTASLLTQLALSSGMVAVTVLLHLIGLGLLISLIGPPQYHSEPGRAHVHRALVLVGAAFGLFALHTVEIWLYALLYFVLGATPGFEEALYFSTVTYATIGYGDLTLAREWRILGAIEGANGIILMGWSTAFFISIVARIRALEHHWGNDDVGNPITPPPSARVRAPSGPGGPRS